MTALSFGTDGAPGELGKPLSWPTRAADNTYLNDRWGEPDESASHVVVRRHVTRACSGNAACGGPGCDRAEPAIQESGVARQEGAEPGCRVGNRDQARDAAAEDTGGGHRDHRRYARQRARDDRAGPDQTGAGPARHVARRSWRRDADPARHR